MQLRLANTCLKTKKNVTLKGITSISWASLLVQQALQATLLESEAKQDEHLHTGATTIVVNNDCLQ